ncbi:MAG: ferrochelatase [Gammaproteobacteria bacterium]|nr:ferrochelatase [Gammaproteobacteria bacterium]
MRGGYRGRTNGGQTEPGGSGVLLVNLGTPCAPTSRAVRRYLAEFLSDPRVLELPGWLRATLLHGWVLRTRPRKTAAAYREVWSEAGSPLLVESRALEQALRSSLSTRAAAPVPVRLAMRYGEPPIEAALEELLQAGAERLLVLPLYPQYSGATTGSAFDAVTSVLQRMRWIPEVRFVNHYHAESRYIAALTDSIVRHRDESGKTERLLFSFHGMPKATVAAGDPYFHQCRETARLVAEKLELPPGDWGMAFQSRFGRAEWLQPATDATLRQWAQAGVESVGVVCPGFAVDCLETLQEVNIRYRELWRECGGKRFEYVPALNDTEGHVGALTVIAARGMCGWPEDLLG